MARVKHTKQKRNKGRFSASIATLLIVVLAFVIFLYRDKLSPSSLGAFSRDRTEIMISSEPFTYENGSKQIFALMGDKLAIASSTGLQLLDDNGNTISREVFSMANPAVRCSGNYSAFFDVGGKSLRIFKDGQSHDFDRETAIISVAVNSSGYFTVTEEEAGYKGTVTVYDSDLDPLYKWYSGSGYALDSVVSPDNSMLAILCADSSGSTIRLFRFDSEEELASVSIKDELAFKVNFTKNGNFYALSEKAIHFFDSSGNALSSYSFDEYFLANYELSDEFCAVVLSKYVSGSGVTLISFGTDGKVLGSLPLSEEPLSLSSQGQKLLVLDASSIALYSGDLRMQKKNHVTPGFTPALLLPKGNVLLLSSHYGEKCEFR